MAVVTTLFGVFMRYFLMSVVFAFSLSACDWNTDHDYHPKAEFQAFLKKQELAKKKAAAAAPAAAEGTAQPAATNTAAPAAQPEAK
jgi:hypothetical protein